MSEPESQNNIRKEILVADDTPASLQLLTRILSDCGYMVRPASSGRLALRSAKARKPDLILLDIKMPDIDGVELCRSLKADESIRDIPVIFISALGDTVEKLKGFEVGGVDYITKPFEPGEVLARVGIHLRMRKLTKGLHEANELLEKRVEERTERLAAANRDLQAELAERKRVEKALDLMKFSIEHASIGAHLLDKDGRFLYVNDQMCRSLGYTRDELLAMGIPDIDPEFPLSIWKSKWTELKSIGTSRIETRHRRKDGSTFPVEISANYVEFSGQEYDWAFAQDISERKVTEGELQRSHDLIKTIMDNMNDAISLIDVRSFRIVGANRMFMELFGGESEIIGKPCYQITHGRSDACGPPNDICPLAETLRTGEHSSAEHVHYAKGGKKIYVEVSTSPIRDEHGVITRVVHVARDITERKETERKILGLNEDLRLNVEKLAFLNKELESFSYSVSHDLRAPVRRISSLAQIMLEEHDAELSEECGKFINSIRGQSQRMDELIKALLSLSHVGRREIQIARLDMNKIVREICNEMKEMHPHRNLQLIIKDMPSATGDRMLIRQVLSNLLGNAIKFTSGRETTEIEISGQNKGDENIYCVRDNGIGFDMQYAYKLFSPFQRLTSAKEFGGTGLGLSIVQRIIHRHGGRIWAESERNKGARFWFTLPAIEPENRGDKLHRGSFGHF